MCILLISRSAILVLHVHSMLLLIYIHLVHTDAGNSQLGRSVNIRGGDTSVGRWYSTIRKLKVHNQAEGKAKQAFANALGAVEKLKDTVKDVSRMTAFAELSWKLGDRPPMVSQTLTINPN